MVALSDVLPKEQAVLKRGIPPSPVPSPLQRKEDHPLSSCHNPQTGAHFKQWYNLFLLYPCHHTHSDHNKVIEISAGEDNSFGNCKYFRLKVSKINLEVAMTTEENNTCYNS